MIISLIHIYENIALSFYTVYIFIYIEYVNFENVFNNYFDSLDNETFLLNKKFV